MPLLVLVTALVSACSVGAAASRGDAGDEPSTPGGGYAYLDQVDANGLIDGLTYSQFFGRKVFDCIVGEGWTTITLKEDGAYGGDVPEEQRDAYDASQDRCQEKVEAMFPTPVMSDRAIRERYGYELKTRQCLITQGYSISEPPSVEVWLEQFKNPQDGLWLPYAEVGAVGVGASQELRSACPDPADRFYQP